VYCLGEGYDNPIIDTKTFAENMASNIRITQAASRGLRKNVNFPNKRARIILPILIKDDEDYLNNKTDLQHVKEIIHKLGVEDETIIQKVKVFNLEIKPNNKSPIYTSPTKTKCEDRYDFGEFDEDLTNKVILYERQRASFEIGYDRAVSIIAGKHIRSKEEYYALCELDTRLPTEPDKTFKHQYTNWIEYLSIKRIYYNLDTCKNKVGEYLLLYPEIKKHYLDLSIVSNELCKIDVLFPPNGLWVEYYNVNDLRDIITITNKKKKMGVIL
jgi:hypothetical protein